MTHSSALTMWCSQSTSGIGNAQRGGMFCFRIFRIASCVCSENVFIISLYGEGFFFFFLEL